jgi:hypothetical protein
MRYVIESDDTQGYRIYIVIDTVTGDKVLRYVSLDRATSECSELNRPL